MREVEAFTIMRTILALTALTLVGCGPAVGDTPGDPTPDVPAAADRPPPPEVDAAVVTPAPREVAVLGARVVGTSAFNGASQPWGGGTVFLDHGNEVRFTDDRDPSNGITGFRSPTGQTPFEVMPRAVPGCPGFFGGSPYGTRAWIRSGDGAWAFFAKGCTRAGPGDDFRGIGLARWSAPGDPLARRADGPVTADPELLFGAGGFQPEAAVLRVGAGADATLYAWDCHEIASLAFQCRLGRAPEARVDAPSAWTFWTGSAWSATASPAVLFRSAGSVLTVSWNAALGRYLAITGGWGADAVYYRTAPAPEGPWSSERVLFEVERPVVEGLWSLFAHHHPGWDRDDGATIFVTYNTTADNGATVRTPVVAVTLGLR